LNQALTKKESHQSAGGYTFAEDFQSLQRNSSESNMLLAVNPANQNGNTNIAHAIELATSSADRAVVTRIVLLSDGNETKSSVMDSLDRINEERITIDVLPVEPASGNEVVLTEFQTPAQGFMGEELSFTLIVEADQESAGEIVLSVNDA